MSRTVLIVLGAAVLAVAAVIELRPSEQTDVTPTSVRRASHVAAPPYAHSRRLQRPEELADERLATGETQPVTGTPSFENPAMLRPGPPNPLAQEQARQSAETAADAAARLASATTTALN